MTALDTRALLVGVTDPSTWQVMNDYDGRSVVIANVDGEIVDGMTHYSYDFIATCEDEYGETPANAAANARLIASAPRLARRVMELEEALEPFARMAVADDRMAGLNPDQLRYHVAKARAALTIQGEAK